MNRTILEGDFNPKHNLWGCPPISSTSRSLLKFVRNNIDRRLFHNLELTHYPYNNSKPLTKDLNIREPESLPEHPSDHSIVKFKILKDFQRDTTSEKVYDYSTTNWKEFLRTLNT